MKNTLLTSFLILFLCIHNMDAQAELGISVGIANHQGDVQAFSDDNIGIFTELRTAFGITYKYDFSERWAFRGNANLVRLGGSDKNFADISHVNRGFSFNSTATEISAMAQWNFLGKTKKDSISTRKITPYFMGGVGLAILDFDVDFALDNSVEVRTDKQAETWQFILPVGAGLRYNVSDKFGVGAEVVFRLPVSDYYDGISLSANPDLNDSYGVASLNFFVAVGKQDKDGDGVLDKEDDCPTIPGSRRTKGCPDADGDRVTDAKDECPNIAGKRENNGCPDTDNDGIVDSKDNCPEVAGVEKFAGCPDTDGDGLADKDDACPEVAGLAKDSGCPDTDGDGIVDKFDNCPAVPGVISENGCPMSDRDNDGIADTKDDCPDEKGTEEFRGCASGDTDKDGVRDHVDSCPNTAGSVAYQGCPAPKTPTIVEEKLNFATRNINFATGSRALTQNSRTILDEIVDVLNAYPNERISINGYTDNVGNSVNNQKLSERRAKSCFDYLVGKGIARARLSYAGYGEENALMSNSTAEGRLANRRVEFVLR